MVKDMLKMTATWMPLILVLIGVAPTPAHAQFRVWNQSFDVANVAVGQLNRDEFRTGGWWKIGPNQCANVIRDPLETRYIYVYAQDVFGKDILNGVVPICVAPDRFIIDAESGWLVREHLDARFVEVDTQDTERWTLFISARPERLRLLTPSQHSARIYGRIGINPLSVDI